MPFLIRVCASFPGMHQGARTHVDSVMLCDKSFFCTLTRKEHRGVTAGRGTSITPMRKLFSYNKHSGNRLSGMMRLNSKQLQSNMLA